MTKSINKLCLALLWAAACGESQVQDTESTSLDAILDNGVQLNGVTLNGVTLNGVTLNGVTLNGVTLNGVTLNGVTLNGVTLNGPWLSAQRADNGVTVSGKDLVGSKAKVQISSGNNAVIRLDDITYNSTAGIYVYNVSLQTDSGWVPICGTSDGVPVPAVPVPGTWDLTTGDHTSSSSAFTLGCVNAAIGKCVIWGYHPWENKTECSGYSCRSQSLSNWQQACTRLVRADYCGDGVPHTRNGTPINVWDTLGIQTPDDTDWNLEAEWATDGAHCIQHTRWVHADLTSPYPTDLSYVAKNCPSRLASSGQEKCGQDSNFNTKKGLYTSTSKRDLIRNQSALNQ